MLDATFEQNVRDINTTKNTIIALTKKLQNETGVGADEVVQIGMLLDKLEIQSYNYGYEYSKKFYNVG